eukprot:2130029-Amphidinium_carterae.1
MSPQGLPRLRKTIGAGTVPFKEYLRFHRTRISIYPTILGATKLGQALSIRRLRSWTTQVCESNSSCLQQDLPLSESPRMRQWLLEHENIAHTISVTN